MDQVSEFLPGILLAYSAFLLSIMSPGPNILAVIGTAMSVGRRPGTALALGVSTGSVCWATLTVAGLSALLSAYAEALTVIKIVGGCFLLWLAYKAIRSAASAYDIDAVVPAGPRRSEWGYYLRGLTVQMTNPKAVLAWIAIMSLGLQVDAPSWVGIVLVVSTGTMSALIHCLCAVAFSTRTMLRFYGGARRWIQGALGAFFCVAGLKLLLSRS